MSETVPVLGARLTRWSFVGKILLLDFDNGISLRIENPQFVFIPEGYCYVQMQRGNPDA